MCVPVGNDVTAWKPRSEPLVASARRPCVVDEPEQSSLELDHEPLRQFGSEGGLVDVSPDGPYGRPERLELGESGTGRQVACVKHEVGSSNELDAGSRQAPRPPRQVRVAEERDQGRPGRKRPSR